MTAFDLLLPRDTAIVEAVSGKSEDSHLFPVERAYIAKAVDKRRQEFTVGRACARQALVALGFSPVPIAVGPGREPIFPDGFSGTITHTFNYCCAAVIRRGDIMSIGIDAETAEPLGANVAEAILLPEERRMLARLSNTGLSYGKVVFSIKEAFYKAFFQRSAQFIDFRDAEVKLIPTNRSFEICLLKTNVDEYFQATTFRGRYDFDEHRVYAAIALPSRS